LLSLFHIYWRLRLRPARMAGFYASEYWASNWSDSEWLQGWAAWRRGESCLHSWCPQSSRSQTIYGAPWWRSF
jgi:hypothetical protein